jgi:hypothetical protein
MRDSTYLRIVAAVYRPVYRSAFRDAVRDRLVDPDEPRGRRFLASDVDQLLAATWREVGEILPAAHVAQFRNRGSQANVFCIALMLAGFRALRAFGVQHEYALDLCADAGWKLYAKFAVLPKAAARLRSRNPQQRLNFVWRTYVRFPFTPAGPPGTGRPGYECQTRWEPDAGYTTFTSCAPLNFVRQLIEEQGDDGELAFFQRTFCTYDWPLVDFLVGRPARYERSHTLSFGDDRCDMLWSATPPLAAAPSTRTRRLATTGGG